MRVFFRVDQVESIRRGVNSPARETSVEFDPAAMPDHQRALLAEAVHEVQDRAAGTQSYRLEARHLPHSQMVVAKGPALLDLIDALRRRADERSAEEGERRLRIANEIAAVSAEAAANLKASKVREETAYGGGCSWTAVRPDSGGYGYKQLNYARGREAEVAVWQSPEWAAWEAECEAATQANRVAAEAERDAEKTAREAEKRAAAEATEAGKAKLRAWAERHGSELAKARIEDGYDCWVTEADGNLADHLGQSVAGHLSEVDESRDPDSIEDRKCPTLAEIKALRECRQIAAGVTDWPVGVRLVRCTYGATTDEYGEEEEPKRVRTELEVSVELWPGNTSERYYLIPAE